MSGQASYAAANAALETFAQWRRRRGQPAIALALGPIADVGMAARHANIARYVELYGYTAIPTERLAAILDRALSWNRPILSVFDVNWHTWAAAEPRSASNSRFAALLAQVFRGGTHTSELRETLTRLPGHERVQRLVAATIAALADVLGVGPDQLEPETPLNALGLDSLTMLELQTHLNRTLDTDLSLMGLFAVNTIHDVAHAIDERIEKLPERNSPHRQD